MKNQFFHARQPREGIFEICSSSCYIFTIEVFFQNGRHCFVFEKQNLKFEIYIIFNIYFQKITVFDWIFIFRLALISSNYLQEELSGHVRLFWIILLTFESNNLSFT